MSNHTQVPGHGLMHEGAAYMKIGGTGYVRVRPQGTDGTGVGRCWCGAVSGFLTSGNLRKAWHRNHKAEALAERSVTP